LIESSLTKVGHLPGALVNIEHYIVLLARTQSQDQTAVHRILFLTLCSQRCRGDQVERSFEVVIIDTLKMCPYDDLSIEFISIIE